MTEGNLFELIMKQKIVAIIFIITFMLLTIELIRRRALKERYAILWVVAAFVLIPMVASHQLVAWLSRMLGIAYPPLTILLTGILFLIMINLHFSIALSRRKENETRLVMRIIEQDEKIADLEKKSEALLEKSDPGNKNAP